MSPFFLIFQLMMKRRRRRGGRRWRRHYAVTSTRTRECTSRHANARLVECARARIRSPTEIAASADDVVLIITLRVHKAKSGQLKSSSFRARSKADEAKSNERRCDGRNCAAED